MIKLPVIIKRSWPFLLFLTLYVFILYKVILQGLMPFPGDLLVSWFFPYKDGGWSGYHPFITQKEFIAADVIRQLYPWRILAVDIFRSGNFPLWNPYSFAGTPLLANVQSAVFYPLNILFFFFSHLVAWKIYILIQPILAFICMYLFIRSLRLGKLAALFAGLTYGFFGYMTVWLELGVVGHTALWLPLVLWSINMMQRTSKRSFLLVGSIGIAFSLLAGHAQTAAYALIIIFSYYLFIRIPKDPVKEILRDMWFIFLGISMAAVQILPSLEFMELSARTISNSSEVFSKFKLPFENIVTIFVPDFFGNPAAGNFWGSDYGEFVVYVGVITLLMGSIGMMERKSLRTVKFFLITAIVALLFALPLPFSDVFLFLKVPILSTSLPARASFIVAFSLIIIAAYGVDTLQKEKKFSLKPIIILLIIYTLILGFPLLYQNNDLKLGQNISVIKRNFILPFGTFLIASFGIIASRYKFSLRYPVLILCIFLAAFEYQYFFNKYSPLAPDSYIFPSHPLTTYLMKTVPDRVHGHDNAGVATNLPVAWRILSPDGYDPLYIKRYGEMMHYVKNGDMSPNIPRSDVVLPDPSQLKESHAANVMTNLLGIKYILDKSDTEYSGAGEDKVFPKSRYDTAWQEYRWRVYRNNESLERAIVFYDGVVKKNESDILTTLFSPSFPYRSKIILEETPPGFEFTSHSPSKAKIVKYTANEVIVSVKTKEKGILFLSDAYYPGWIAYVNGTKTKIYRTDYAFRGVVVEKGKNDVVFIYQPLTFLIGAVISLISLLIVIVLGVKWRRV